MNCLYCNRLCIKKGKYKKEQRYKCNGCGKYQQEHYSRKRYSQKFYEKLPVFLKEGMSISSMARIFAISKSTVIRKIQKIADTVSKPVISEYGQEYEVDEMHTFIGSNTPGNYRYIIYAINKRTRQIIDYIVGRRTK